MRADLLGIRAALERGLRELHFRNIPLGLRGLSTGHEIASRGQTVPMNEA